MRRYPEPSMTTDLQFVTIGCLPDCSSDLRHLPLVPVPVMAPCVGSAHYLLS